MSLWVDKIVYGNPFDNIIPLLKQECPFDSLLPKLKSHSFPSNSSETTEHELRQLMQFQKSEEQTNEALVNRYIDYDKDLASTFYEFCEDNNIKDGVEIVDKLLKDTRPLIAKLKYFYNRPRPYQIAYYYKAKLVPYASYSAMTPSYPSGHCVQAFLLSEVIGSKYPQYYEPLKFMANDIEKSRMFLGLHFESDCDFARVVVQSILRNKDFTKEYGI